MVFRSMAMGLFAVAAPFPVAAIFVGKKEGKEYE